MNKSRAQNSIPLDHTLHGYQNGHTLLSASIDLPSEAKRQLLVMSDMSGTSMHKGYEEYITGYPIKDIGCYALAKTWYAPEMARPGCVWTHTILIRFTDLINVTDYEALISLYKRPQKELDYGYYGEKLDLELSEPRYTVLKETAYPYKLVYKIIYDLYSNSNSPLFIENSSADSYQKLLLCIWLQQWPRLKRNFSFCTGSIGARSINNKLLDLQVVPFFEVLPKSEPINYVTPGVTNEIGSEQWCNTIVDDLYRPSSLRKYINSFGADVKATKKSFKSLALVYPNLVPKVNLECGQMIKLLSNEFPKIDEAATLKSFALDAYAEKNTSATKNSGLENVKVLYELATTEGYSAFDPTKLRLREHIKELYDQKPEQVFEMFDRMLDSQINPLGVEMLQEVAKRSGSLNFDLIDKNEKVIQSFVHINSEIVYNESFWNVSWARQQENLGLLLTPRLRDNINWGRLIAILLEKNIDIDFNSLQQIDLNVVDFLLSWLNSDKVGGGAASLKWKLFLGDRPETVMQWLKTQEKVNSTVINLLIELLNPNSEVVVTRGTDVWRKLLLGTKQTLSYPEENRLKSFILALAFNNSNEGSLDLVVSSFETVYSALLNNNLDYSSWQLLERHTKPLVWWNDWDKARKLAIALVEISKKNKWPAAAFGKMFKDKKVAERFLSHYRNM
jgi:hypothetical protein